MKITAIEQQKRNDKRYSVFVDGKYTFSLSENDLMIAAIRVGDDLSAQRLDELKDQSQLGKYMDQAYRFLSYRSRSVHEIQVYLRRKGAAEEEITEVVSILGSYKLLDDETFAREWILNRQLLKPRSDRQLTAELKEKGISSDTITLVMADTKKDELSTVKEIIDSKNLLQKYSDDQKLIRYLAGKGFSYEDIKTAIEQLRN